MKRKTVNIVMLILGLSLLIAGTASANGKPWNDQLHPYDFLFGNHIDTHQQTKEMPDGTLKGFLYIEFTGEFTADGYPIAKHTDCYDEISECTVGWTLQGVPGEAMFVYHDDDHPLWMVSSRNDIPQPGAFSHFHWLDGPQMAMGLMDEMVHEGYFLELRAKDTFAFKHGGEKILVTPGIDLATHLNIVSSFPTITGGGDGGDNGSHDH